MAKRVEEIILRKIETLEAKFDAKLDSMESKIDKLATEAIPGLKIEQAVMQEKIATDTKSKSKIYALVGGAIAVLTSVGISAAVEAWKHWK